MSDPRTNSLNEPLIPRATLRSHVPGSATGTVKLQTFNGRTALSQSRAAVASGGTAVNVHMPPCEMALSLRGEVFHLFISYRADFEARLVGELYQKLLTDTKAAEIPDISRWPSKSNKPEQRCLKEVAPSRVHVFWDKKCLVTGEPWKDGFVSALKISLVFMPLLSIKGTAKWADPVVNVDNVLLELILALEFNRLSQQSSTFFPCKFIMPVFVDDFKDINMSKDPARETMKEAREILETMGLRPSCDYSPHEVINALQKFQGVQMFLYHDKHDKLREQALDKVVKEALTAVVMCIQTSSVFIHDFKLHHPRARELCDWLRTHSMSKYTGVIARHGITSVHALLLLDVGSAIPVLAEDCAPSCTETRMQSIVALSRAVALAKSSELSLPLSARLNRFVDTEASILSALYSSCGCDAVFCKPTYLIMLILVSIVSACAGVFEMGIVDESFLSVSMVMNPLFWFIMSASTLCVGLWPVAFGGSIFKIPSTEFKPRIIAVGVIVCIAVIWTIIIIYTKAVYFGSISLSHSIHCEAALQKGALTVSFDTCYLYELFVVHSVQFIGLLSAGAFVYSKQEFAFRTMILAALFADFASFGFNEIIIFDNQQTLRVIFALIAVVASMFLLTFESLNAYSKIEAATMLKVDVAAYKEKWTALMENADERNQANDLQVYISQSFGGVFDGPSARWFSKRPHVTQEHSDIDLLFDDAQRADVAFQELVQCWLQVIRALCFVCCIRK
jgi:hypothetical protein